MRRVAGFSFGNSEVEVVSKGELFYFCVDGKVVEEFEDMREALERFEEVVLELRRSGKLNVLKRKGRLRDVV